MVWVQKLSFQKKSCSYIFQKVRRLLYVICKLNSLLIKSLPNTIYKLLDPPWRQGREAHVVGGMVWLVLLPNWAWDRWFTWITIRRRLYHQYLFYCDFWHFLNIQVEINSRDVIARHRFPKMHPSKVISFFWTKTENFSKTVVQNRVPFVSSSSS